MDKVSEAVKNIHEGVKQVFTSEKYLNFLSFAAKFHRYSARNMLLIYSQKPDASYVAGFKAWQNMGASVKKGEKSISIFAPMLIKEKHTQTKTDEDGNVVLGSKGEPETENTETKRLAFRLVNVFDISQTTAEPPALVSELQGEDAKADCLIEAIREISQYSVCVADDTNDELLQVKKDVKGYCNYFMRQIVVRDGMSGIQTAKTLLHEYAHSLFHEDADKTSRSAKEVEAESTAYILATYFGLDTSEYSMPYIATWSNEKPEVLEDVLSNIQEKVQQIIDGLEPVYTQKVQEYLISNNELEAIRTDLER